MILCLNSPNPVSFNTIKSTQLHPISQGLQSHIIHIIEHHAFLTSAAHEKEEKKVKTDRKCRKENRETICLSFPSYLSLFFFLPISLIYTYIYSMFLFNLLISGLGYTCVLLAWISIYGSAFWGKSVNANQPCVIKL